MARISRILARAGKLGRPQHDQQTVRRAFQQCLAFPVVDARADESVGEGGRGASTLETAPAMPRPLCRDLGLDSKLAATALARRYPDAED
jgi:hypothetical protein